MEIKSLSEVHLHEAELILLDLDNTLYSYHSCHTQALQDLVQHVQKHFDVGDNEVKDLYLGCRKIVHNRHLGTGASHSRLFYIQEMVEKLCNRTNIELISTLTNVYWSSFINQMQLCSDAIPFLEKCLQDNTPVVMVTDMTTEVQFKKIKKLGIEKYLSFVLTSEQAGVEKPHPYIFELAISKALQVNKNIRQIALVGDDVKKDMYSSDFYSIDVYHIDRSE